MMMRMSVLLLKSSLPSTCAWKNPLFHVNTLFKHTNIKLWAANVHKIRLNSAVLSLDREQGLRQWNALPDPSQFLQHQFENERSTWDVWKFMFSNNVLRSDMTLKMLGHKLYYIFVQNTTSLPKKLGCCVNHK